MPLSRDQIRSAPARVLKTAMVPMPEWAPPGTDPAEATVIIRQYRGTDTDAISALRERAGTRPGANKNPAIRAQMIIRACISPDGQRLFNESDADWLTREPVTVTNRIIEALTELNGGEELEAETVKNSESGQSEDSPSD